MSTATPPITISDEQRQQYQDEGYMILENVIPPEHLELLRGQCQRFMDDMDRQMDEKGTDTIGINHRNKRYFVANCFRKQPELRRFLFSDVMLEVCRATLGETVYLFHEQYVVKGAETGMKFSWHQDSGYVGHPFHEPYLTCWCALDDMSIENGTVSLLPFSHLGIKTFVKHILEPGSNDLVGYFGELEGIQAIVPAGSIVAFTSVNFHSSGTNSTPNLRRVYLAQYSKEVILDRKHERPWANFEPFIIDGERKDFGEVPTGDAKA